MKILRFVFLFFFLHTAFGYSQTPSKLNSEIEKLKSDVALKHASWSVCVMPVNKDVIIAEYNSNVSLVPASTMKLVTTGAALSILGSDFKFETKLQYDGIFDSINGIIKGNLFIKGGGDPSLDSKYFKDDKDSSSITDKWALILKSKGIRKIEGAIIADASIFEDNSVPAQWIWADMGNYFGAGASGLSYHDNEYSLYFNSGKPGTTTILTTVLPKVENLQIINKVQSGGATDSAYIYGSPYTYYRTVEGTIPPDKSNFEVKGSLPDPSLYCAKALEASLKRNGIGILKNATTIRQLKEEGKYLESSRQTIYTNYSPSLDKIVYWTNLKSINLYAEHLLKYMAYVKSGLGTENEGIKTVISFWKSKGVDVSGFSMNDGCGLSRANVITTKTQVQLLRWMAKDKSFKAFYNSLPIAGKSGSLINFCQGTFAENNLCAKSGYITGARGYTGYVKNKKGELFCFSILANNYECTPTEMKKKLEKIVVAIPELE